MDRRVDDESQERAELGLLQQRACDAREHPQVVALALNLPRERGEPLAAHVGLRTTLPHLLDLRGIEALGAIGIVELEDALDVETCAAHVDDVAVGELLALDLGAVHLGSVGRAQVDETRLVDLDLDTAVMPRGEGSGETDVVVDGTADADDAAGELQHGAQPLLDDDQPHEASLSSWPDPSRAGKMSRRAGGKVLDPDERVNSHAPPF